jgi:hypothetical protein
LGTKDPLGGGGFLNKLFSTMNDKGFDPLPEAQQYAPVGVAPVQQSRKSWTFELGGQAHTLELTPRRWRLNPGPWLEIDGQRVGILKSPGARHARTEWDSQVAGHRVTVALEWRRGWEQNLRVDVLVDGKSVLDGRTLEETRADAPASVGWYDAEMSRLQRKLLNIAGFAAAGIFATGWGIGFTLGLVISLLFAIWEIGWFGGLWLLNRVNLSRPHWGAIRWLTFFGYAIGYPIVSSQLLMNVVTAAR